MPWNIRAKPPQSKLSTATKNSVHADTASSHSRFSRSPKQVKGKQASTSTPGYRSGLEPGSVLGGISISVSNKLSEGPQLVVRPGSKSKPVAKRATHGLATAPGGKTLSMENIQSLSAAYATSGTMYPSERDSLETSAGFPRGTMTLGRNTRRLSYTGRSTVMGSSPNITSSGLHHLSDPYADQTFLSVRTSSLQRQSGRQIQMLDCAGQGEVSRSDLQSQLRELWRENDSLRRELDGGRDARMGVGTNSVNFWCPDVKRDKGTRQEDTARMAALKDHDRTNHEDVRLPLMAQELQEELRAHREMNSRLWQQNQQQEGSPGSYQELHMDQDCKGGLSPGHSHGPKSSSRASPSNTYDPTGRQQGADIIIHSPGYGCSATVTMQRLSPVNTLQPGQRNSLTQPLYSPNQAPALPAAAAAVVGPGSTSLCPCSPCQVPGCDGFSSPPPPLVPSEEAFLRLQSEHERQAKELLLLRRTMEEMEKRIDSQRQTLGARDESIQRLLEMLQCQGQGHGQHWGRGQQVGSIIAAAAQEAKAHLENMHVREELRRRNQLQAEPVKTRALQTVIDMKDTKISSLERNIRDLEDEVQMLKTSGLLQPDDRQDELKQVDVYKSHSKFMKSKTEQLKQELNRKESEMQALQTKLETLANQNSDCKQHIEVLKESLSAKEQRASTLQTETENLLEQLKDKDKQLAGLRERVQGLQTDSSNTDTALATLEEALSEKERVIENLREQREREDRVCLEELEQLRKENQELKDKRSVLEPLKTSQSQITNHSLTPNQRPDGEAPAKINGPPAVSPTTLNTEESVKKCPDINDRLRLLEQEVSRYREESGKSQAEVERLMAALREAETDKTCWEKKITDPERQIKSPNIQKQMFPDDMRKDASTDGHPHSLSQDAMRETAEQIKELEMALRESMNTSAHREALWAQEEAARVQAQIELEELMGALEKTRQELDATKLRLSSTQQSLRERDGHLNNMRQERRQQLGEILEMKQQALLAAISEKDANIALLELSASKRKKTQEEVMALKREKDILMHQLKQQTQSRMKLRADKYGNDHSPPQHHLHHTHHMLHPANAHHRNLPRGHVHSNHRPPMDQDDEEGIWA